MVGGTCLLWGKCAIMEKWLRELGMVILSSTLRNL